MSFRLYRSFVAWNYDVRHRLRRGTTFLHDSRIFNIITGRAMLTQIRDTSQKGEEKPALHINTIIQLRFRLGRFVGERASLKNEIDPAETIIQSLELVDSVPLSSFKKYELQSSPRKTPRKKLKLSSYQLYKEEQKSLKECHYNKLVEWKSKFLALKSELNHRKPNIPRNHSFSQTHSPKDSPTSFQTLSHFKSVQQGNNRFNISKTRDSRQKMADNNVNIRKIKTRMEFCSLSTIISDRKERQRPIVPNIQTLNPHQLPSRQQQKRRSGTADFIERKDDPKKMEMIKTQKKRQIKTSDFGCYRPWSGVKADWANDLANIL